MTNFNELVKAVSEIVDAHIENKISYANQCIAAWHSEESSDKRVAAYRKYVLEKSMKTISEYTF